jgi:glutamate--cysteine ligase
MMKRPLSREFCRSFIESQIFEPPKGSNIPSGHIGFVGLEMEAFPYAIDYGQDASVRLVRLSGGNGSLSDTLARAAAEYGGAVQYFEQDPEWEGAESRIERIVFEDGCSFHFEPGGQVEISTCPCDNLISTAARLRYMQDILGSVTRHDHIHFAQVGTNPWFDADEIGLQMQKPRYRALQNYFDGIGPYGKQMMRQTCSLQVNLDLGTDEETRIKRIIAANLLAPFGTAMFANSSVIAGSRTGYQSYRSFIWQHLDPARTGIFPVDRISESSRREDIIDLYLNFALDAPLIYIKAFGDEVLPRNFTMGYWLENPIKGISPDEVDLRNHLSLLFPEVRLKGYLEIRSIDAPPPEWQLVPAIFYTGLFYSNRHLDKTIELLFPLRAQLPSLMEQATHGLASLEIYRISKEVIKLAVEGFSGLPADFGGQAFLDQIVSFMERFTMQRRTFAGNAAVD